MMARRSTTVVGGLLIALALAGGGTVPAAGRGDPRDEALAREPRRIGVGVVPADLDGGTIFFRARLPAIASIGIIIMKRPISMVMPIVVLYQSVLAEMPAKAEPLLPAPSV